MTTEIWRSMSKTEIDYFPPGGNTQGKRWSKAKFPENQLLK